MLPTSVDPSIYLQTTLCNPGKLQKYHRKTRYVANFSRQGVVLLDHPQKRPFK